MFGRIYHRLVFGSVHFKRYQNVFLLLDSVGPYRISFGSSQWVVFPEVFLYWDD